MRNVFKSVSGLTNPLVIAVVMLVCVHAPALAQQQGYWPDYYMVTTTATFRPVTVPGTQRRVAQTDAELKARRLLQEYAGAMPVGQGRTVNDVIAHDARLKAKILEYIRTAEVVDWRVNPGCACVQVWVRIDLNAVRSILTACGYR